MPTESHDKEKIGKFNNILNILQRDCELLEKENTPNYITGDLNAHVGSHQKTL